MRPFRGLEVWQKAHALTMGVYRETRSFPRAEEFGLMSQMRRAATAIPSNIAEGCGQVSQLEFARYLQIAIGSSNELDYQILLSTDLGYLSPEAHRQLEQGVVAVRQMLSRLVATVRSSGRFKGRRHS